MMFLYLSSTPNASFEYYAEWGGTRWRKDALFAKKMRKKCTKRYLNAKRVVYDAFNAIQISYFREYDNSNMP